MDMLSWRIGGNACVMTTEQEIWINGEYLPAQTPAIGALARGVAVGYGVFTTLCLDAGQPILLPWHLERLVSDAQVLGFCLPAPELLARGLAGLVSRNGLEKTTARGRITVLATAADEPPLVVISAVQEELRSGGAKVVNSVYRQNECSPLAGVKATSYAANAYLLAEAAKMGADEVLLYNSRDELCEGASTNLFLVKGKRLLTPALTSGCLPGVMRRWVLQRAPALGLEVCEVALGSEDLAAADEVFLTSSLRGVQAVEEIDGARLAQAMPWTAKLSSLYQSCRRSGEWL